MPWTIKDSQRVWPWLFPWPQNITQHWKGSWSGSGENGVDLGLHHGTPVTSLTSGQVLSNGYYGGGGVVTVESTVPGIGVASVYYQHLDLNNPALTPGKSVKVGDLIGWSGGQLSGGHHPATCCSTGDHIEIGVNAPFGRSSLWAQLGPNVNPEPWIQSLIQHGPSAADIIGSQPGPLGGTPQAFTAAIRGNGPVADDFASVEQAIDDLMTIQSLSAGIGWSGLLPWEWGNTAGHVTSNVAHDLSAVFMRVLCFLVGLCIIIVFLVNVMRSASSGDEMGYQGQAQQERIALLAASAGA